MVEEKENIASANAAAAGQEPVSKKGAKKQAKAAKVRPRRVDVAQRSN